MSFNLLPLVLASKSQSRQKLLRQAGLNFSLQPGDIDERALEEDFWKGKKDKQFHQDSFTELTLILARAKALAAKDIEPNEMVLGFDQICFSQNQIFHQPKTLANLRSHLASQRGQSHQLVTTIVAIQNGEPVWDHTEIAHLTFAEFTDDFLDQVIKADGDQMRFCAGGYRIEGPAIQLFQSVKGDYFSIMGLPLLPLLAFLRTQI